MPENDVTFLAFGQDHRNGESLKELTAKIKELHAAKVPVVICVEHGPGATAESERELLRYRAALGGYLDKCYKNLQSDPPGPGPNKEDFNRATEGIYDSMLSQGGDYHRYVTGVDFKSNWAANELCGRSAAAAASLEMMDYACANKIPVRGLDHPNKEKLYRTQGADAAEFTRIDHMANEALKYMQEMADADGGVIIAVNMGASHVGNLEVSLREKLEDAKLAAKANVMVHSSVMLDHPVNSPEISVIGKEPEQGRAILLEGAQRIERHAMETAKKVDPDRLSDDLEKQKRRGGKYERILQNFEGLQPQNLADLKAVLESSGQEFDDEGSFKEYLDEMAQAPGYSSFVKDLPDSLDQDLNTHSLEASDSKAIMDGLKKDFAGYIQKNSELIKSTEHWLERTKAGVGHEAQGDWQFAQRAKAWINQKDVKDPTNFLRPAANGSYEESLKPQMAKVMLRHAPAMLQPVEKEVAPPAPNHELSAPSSPSAPQKEDVRASLMKSELRQRKISPRPNSVGANVPELAAPERPQRAIPQGKLKTD